MTPDGIRIERWHDTPDKTSARAAIEVIFFEASGTKSFANEAVRQAFHERWLGRYFHHFPAWVYLARDKDDRVAGYLVGSLDDPARNSLFDDIPVLKDFGPQTARFPAHLHVNCAPEWRSHGVGAALVERFAADAAAAGAPGVHIVTGEGLRNVRFYERIGFSQQARAVFNGKAVVMLARKLG